MSDETFNPFVYSVPVEPEDLLDREAEARQLHELGRGGHFTRLSAPRRYGKTSLLRRVLRDAEREGMNVALIDLYGVVGPADVAVRLREGYRAFRGPVARRAERLVANATLRIGLGPGSLELSALPAKPAEQAILELLELPREVHERTGERCLIVWDEFQELLAAGEHLDAILRSRIQHQAAAASYIFAGSHEGMLATLFDRRERPLYGQARKVSLVPLADADVARYAGERFEASGREAGRALGHLLRTARGHPQRTMLLAHHLWSHTPPGGTADEDAWRETLRSVHEELREGFAAAWDGLAEDSDRRFLSATADGARPFAAATLDRAGLSRATAARSRDRLLDSGVLIDHGHGVRVTDPLWRDWIAAGRRIPTEAPAEAAEDRR